MHSQCLLTFVFYMCVRNINMFVFGKVVCCVCVLYVITFFVCAFCLVDLQNDNKTFPAVIPNVDQSHLERSAGLHH